MRIDYGTISTLAKQIGCRRDDLIALAPNNDPFYVEVPSRREAAEWFGALWERLGFKPGSHPRRLHYITISQDPPVAKPDGTAYQNTENDWKFFLTASLAARYLHLIPDDALVDRRNPSPIINATKPGTSEPEAYVLGDEDASTGIEMPSELDLPSYMLIGFEPRQEYLGEVWVEKSTQNDILMPLAARLGFNLVPGTGETSEILAREAVGRAVADGRPMRILYVSDFDPGGRSMPVALARKIEFWLRDADLDLDITLEPIVLRPEQCETYRLPRTPLKDTEKRAAKFEARFGSGATELDALEALHPGELAAIVENEVCRYIDTTLRSRLREAEWTFRKEVNRVYGEVIARHDVVELQQRFEDLYLELQDLLEDTERAWPAIGEDLRENAPVFDAATLPQAREAEPPPEPLFDSRRNYLDQIDHYRSWQGKGGAR